MNITTINIVTIIFAFIIGGVAGAAFVFFFRRFRLTREMRTAERKAARLRAEAELKAREVVREAKEEAEKLKSATEAEYRERRLELQRHENRVSQKEATLEHKRLEVSR
jgi:ribonuclease Y